MGRILGLAGYARNLVVIVQDASVASGPTRNRNQESCNSRQDLACNEIESFSNANMTNLTE